MIDGRGAILRGRGAHIRGGRAHFRGRGDSVQRWGLSPRAPLTLSPAYDFHNMKCQNLTPKGFSVHGTSSNEPSCVKIGQPV
jgi:hypothetical protein